jgi:hypothetical protein
VDVLQARLLVLTHFLNPTEMGLCATILAMKK